MNGNTMLADKDIKTPVRMVIKLKQDLYLEIKLSSCQISTLKQKEAHVKIHLL